MSLKHMRLLVSCVIICTILMSSSVYALGQREKAEFYSGGLWVEGQSVYILDQDETMLHPIIYSGSVYIPLFAIGEWLGKDVRQNRLESRIDIYGEVGQTIQYQYSSNSSAGTQNSTDVIEIKLGSQWVTYVDGVNIALLDCEGNTLWPIVYNGTTYLPIRSILRYVGWDVNWVDNGRGTQTIYLRSHLSDAELNSISSYLNSAFTLLEKLRGTAHNFFETSENNSALTELNNAKIYYEQFSKLSVPTTRFAQSSFTVLQKRLVVANTDLEEVIRELNMGISLFQIDSSALDSDLISIEAALRRIQQGLKET